jgi:tetratricopeptide (TPR) repeat protein
LTGFALTAVASNREESEFLWQKAWSKTISASTAEDYARAVQDYRELVAGGTRNKHIFYNMGTALLMAGDKESALRAFERAERYGGTDRRIMHNISLASSDSDDEPGTISWKRIVFFWHFALPVSIRTSVAVGAWTLLFTLLALGARNRGHVYRTIFGAVLFILIIFGSSALTSGLQEHRDRIRDTYASRQSLPEENTE